MSAPEPLAAHLPVPEPLLGPLLESAAAELDRRGPEEVPPVLRPLAGFDRRGLASGPARQQLRRGLEHDEGFRTAVVERFLARPEVQAALTSWRVADALALVTAAAERDDLPLLTCTLLAARPEGWQIGVGAACAAADQRRRERELQSEVAAATSRLATAEEAGRRAEEARVAADRQATRLAGELRDERHARRRHDGELAAQARDATGRAEAAEAASRDAAAAVAAAEARRRKEAERALAAERELRELRRTRAEATSAVATAAPPPPADAAALADAAARARALAAALERLATPAAPGPPAAPPPLAGDERRPSRRVMPPCPPGMAADTPEALEAMLRGRGVVLVVDGYNVSMLGWGEVAVADQRDRLVGELSRLHLRLRAGVIVVFDGADVPGVPPARRAGVRIVFSRPGEEADAVVVAEVRALPSHVPVVVASSDAWVREHAEAQGACAVSSSTLLAVLRR